LNSESGGCETGAFERKEKKKKNGFQPATILRRRRRMFTRMNCEIGRIHPV
jgi:hypothetical protein